MPSLRRKPGLCHARRRLARRIDHSGGLWRSKIGTPTLVLPLALAAVLSASGVAEGQTLKVETSWPEQYDTGIGWYPHAGFPPVCAATADPSIAVSNGNLLRIAGNFNYGTYNRNGTSVFQDRLADFFGNGLLPNNTDIGPPALIYDNDSNRLVIGRYSSAGGYATGLDHSRDLGCQPTLRGNHRLHLPNRCQYTARCRTD